jgi:hypothetical protein
MKVFAGLIENALATDKDTMSRCQHPLTYTRFCLFDDAQA